MKKVILFTVLLLVNLMSSQDIEKRQSHFNLENNLAIKGFDPVAYFSNKAKEGQKKYAVKHKSVTYYFSSQENKNIFLKNPAKYEPKYGGWCAYAMGLNGEKVSINPKTYKIIEGKLYLFYNAYFNNTLKSWNKDEFNLKTRADENWSKIITSN